MREIKFRAWNARTGFTVFELGETLLEPLHNYYVTQYTGLKDKNGVEIYEGDIVEVAEDVKTHGKIQDDGKTLWNVIDSGLRFEVGWHTMQPEIDLYPIGESEEADIDTVKLWLWNNDGGSECLKVIGNIYENKDLLK